MANIGFWKESLILFYTRTHSGEKVFRSIHYQLIKHPILAEYYCLCLYTIISMKLKVIHARYWIYFLAIVVGYKKYINLKHFCNPNKKINKKDSRGWSFRSVEFDPIGIFWNPGIDTCNEKFIKFYNPYFTSDILLHFRITFYENDRILLGCLTGFCSTIQNGVSSTGRKYHFWEKKFLT